MSKTNLKLERIDEVDKKIIDVLQRDPNATHSDIAEAVDRTQPTVGSRLDKLKKRGYLQKKYGINIKKSDLYLFIVRVRTKRVQRVIDIATRSLGIINIVRVLGDYNLFLLYCAETMKMGETVINRLRKIGDTKVEYDIASDVEFDFIHRYGITDRVQ